MILYFILITPMLDIDIDIVRRNSLLVTHGWERF